MVIMLLLRVTTILTLWTTLVPVSYIWKLTIRQNTAWKLKLPNHVTVFKIWNKVLPVWHLSSHLTINIFLSESNWKFKINWLSIASSFIVSFVKALGTDVSLSSSFSLIFMDIKLSINKQPQIQLTITTFLNELSRKLKKLDFWLAAALWRTFLKLQEQTLNLTFITSMIKGCLLVIIFHVDVNSLINSRGPFYMSCLVFVVNFKQQKMCQLCTDSDKG